MNPSSQELFLQANAQYAQKNYEKALKLYEKIPHKGAAVWYNMGNCAYKMADTVHAQLYWKRASKTGDSAIQADTIHNLDRISHNQLSAPILAPLAIQILFFCIFSVFLVISCFLVRRKKIMFLAACSLAMGGISFLTYTTYRHITDTKALVMSSENYLYAGPDYDYHQLAPISGGSEVVVLKHADGWAKVSWHNQIGWIKSNAIEVI